MSGKIFVPIVTGFDGAGLSKATSALAGFGKTLGGAVKGFIGISTAAQGIQMAVGALTDGVTQARDLERNFAALNGVFGEFSGKMKMFSRNSAEFGLSAVESAKASVFLGSVLKQSGFSMGDVSDQTQRLVKLASDLATTYGYDVSEALTGMTALFRGEYDPIEKFGVAMKQAEVNALLLERRQNGLTGAALRNAQAVARLDLLYQRAADSMGAFARQSDSLFVAQKKLDASYQNMMAFLGSGLLKPLADFLNVVRESMFALEKPLKSFFDITARMVKALEPAISILIEGAVAFFDILNPIFDMLVSIVDGVMPLFAAVWKVFKVAFKALKGVLDGIAFVVKLVMVGFKMLFIVALALARVFEAIFGPIIENIMGGLGDVFAPANTGIDAFNAELDKTIKNMTEIDGTSMSVSIDAGYIDPAIKRLLELNAAKGAAASGGLSDDQKKKLTDIKASIADILTNIIPGPLIKKQLGELESVVVSSFQDINKQIESLVSEGIFNKKSGDALKKYAKTEADVLGDIASRRDKLANRYNLAKSLMVEIKTAVIGFANLSNIMNDVTENVTVTTTRMIGKFSETITTSGKQIASAGMIIDKYRDILGRTKSFKADLEKLQAMKIDTTLYNQILAGGLDGGAAAASALAEGGQSAVDELNSLFADLSSLGTGLGESTAQMMYGTGVDLTDGLLAGILSADKKLKAAATTLATVFSKSFKAAIATGNTKGLTVDMSAMDSINSASSMTGIAPTSSATINVTVNAGLGTDGAAVGKVIVDAIKKYERTSGQVFATA
jgi:hypothetical protein